MSAVDVDVLVVGGGPAGLAAAVQLRRDGIPRVLVAEREAQTGGIPRHTDHTGFGLQDLHRLYRGPRYAQAITDLAAAAGAQLRPSTTVTGWAQAPPDRLAVELTAPDGRQTLHARAVLLATGCRERPRAARLVPGSRPLGVFTTGALQQLVYLHGQPVGRRAVIVGAEHVSFSAVLTLAHAGARIAGLVTEAPRHQSLTPFRLAAALRYRAPLLTSTRVSAILGRRRVQAVELTDLASGRVRRMACDTVVFTGDWIPDHELARQAGVRIDRGSNGPWVDQGLRTSTPGVFAAGNLLHGAETAAVAALSGRHAATAIRRWLADAAWPAGTPVPVSTAPPLRWVVPAAVTSTRELPPRGRLLLRADQFATGRLTVRQDARLLWAGRRRRLVPGRSIHLPAGWLSEVDLAGGPVTVEVAA
jgi:thioredoxin reductase